MNPYQSLPENAFWSTAIAKRSMFDISGLWSPKYKITKTTPVVTYGSCFAQHIGRALASRDHSWLIAERAPSGLSKENARLFNYGIFSSRTGNIYTVSLLRQWINWSTGKQTVPDEVWVKDLRYYDPFRPGIEPNGFESQDELRESRNVTLECFRRSIEESSVFVFTMGLTESWMNSELGYEYPVCPGTVAGVFDEKVHKFQNQDYIFIRNALIESIRELRDLNPRLKVLLTVSPVPLTATMSNQHVLVATIESKSILRAVAGAVARQFPFVDYFPSYEIINSPPFRGTFFEPNQRGVNPAGVNFVMGNFFAALATQEPVSRDLGLSKSVPVVSACLDSESKHLQAGASLTTSDGVVCEEALLDAFQKVSKK